MSYQVIARKYRPQSFEEVIGQEAAVQTLKNAITFNRLHHAYLFCGGRGIGKTSLARIFAKAINCEKGPSATPCQVCTLCKEITAGTSLDVREIDGASNTSVEDVREIREQLKYLPATGRHKIYIIDEVHMLSNNAFNALLKTLEEPPPHVIFLFATTESHKIPATILSRCQRFDLRKISNEQILSKLKEICQAENINPVEDSLLIITREGAGSLRDAQSLLDQAIALTNGTLNIDSISSMLGLSNSEDIYQITDATLNHSAEKAIQIVHSIYEKGHDLKQFLNQWLEYWKNLLLYQATRSEKIIEGFTEREKQQLIEQSQKTNLETLEIGFHHLYKSSEEISKTEFPKMILEVLAVRLSHLDEMVSLKEILNTIKLSPPPRGGRVGEGVEITHQEKVISNVTLPLVPSPEGRGNPNEDSKLDLFLRYISEEKPQIGSILSHLIHASIEADKILFQFEPKTIWIELLQDRKSQIEEMGTQFFKKPVQLAIEIASSSQLEEFQKQKKIEDPKSNLDPIIHSALEILNAEIKGVNS